MLHLQGCSVYLGLQMSNRSAFQLPVVYGENRLCGLSGSANVASGKCHLRFEYSLPL